LCGKPLSVCNPDLDRQLPEFAHGNAATARLFPDTQHILFVDVEIHIDRIELHDGRELRRRRRADQLANRDQMGADDAVERRNDFGVTVIDRGDPGIDLGLLQIGLRIVAGGRGAVERRLRDGLPLHQIRLPSEVGFGLLQRRLRASLGGLRLFELQLVGLGLDREQRGAFLDESAVLVIDRLQKALNARDEIDGLDRRGVAGGIEETRDGFLHRQPDIDFRRWRRHKTILFAAT
jgi:hypothetical protein